MIVSEGVLRYSEDKLIVEVDPGITAYARALVPRVYRVQPQRWPAHITVVRNEVIPREAPWGLFDGEEVEFAYDPRVRNDTTYWWLDVYAPALRGLRVALGLAPSSEWTRPPDGRECFHTTVGNTKHERRG